MDILDESDVKKMSSEFSQGEIFSYIKHEIKPYQIHETKTHTQAVLRVANTRSPPPNAHSAASPRLPYSAASNFPSSRSGRIHP